MGLTNIWSIQIFYVTIWKWIIFWIKWKFWPRYVLPMCLDVWVITHELYFRFVYVPWRGNELYFELNEIFDLVCFFHVPWRVSFQWLHMNYIFVMFCPCALTCEFPCALTCEFPMITHELYFRYVLPMCLDAWVSGMCLPKSND